MPRGHAAGHVLPPEMIHANAEQSVGKIVPQRDLGEHPLDRTSIVGGVLTLHRQKCSREDSNLHGLPHTVLSRTRLPIPPRERGGRLYKGAAKRSQGSGPLTPSPPP